MAIKKANKYAQKSPLYRFALKVFTQQVSFGLLGFLFVTIFLSFFSEETAMIGTAIGSALIFLFSLSGFFVSAWHVGDRDRNLINYGHISYWGNKALFAALLSLVPAVLLSVPVIMTEMGADIAIWPSVLYKILFAQFLWLFLPVAEAFPFIYLAPLLAIPPMCIWGYQNGYKAIYLAPKVMFRKKRS